MAEATAAQTGESRGNLDSSPEVSILKMTQKNESEAALPSDVRFNMAQENTDVEAARADRAASSDLEATDGTDSFPAEPAHPSSDGCSKGINRASPSDPLIASTGNSRVKKSVTFGSVDIKMCEMVEDLDELYDMQKSETDLNKFWDV